MAAHEINKTLTAARGDGTGQDLLAAGLPDDVLNDVLLASRRAGSRFVPLILQGLPDGWDGRVEAQLVCGVAAAQLASTATYPLPVVRRRMQLGLCAGGGVLQGVRTIAREEGVRRLYAGLGIAYVKAVPSAAIGLVAYDQMKALSLK